MHPAFLSWGFVGVCLFICLFEKLRVLGWGVVGFFLNVVIYFIHIKCAYSPIPPKPAKRKREKLLWHFFKATCFPFTLNQVGFFQCYTLYFPLGPQRSGSLQMFLVTCPQINVSKFCVFSQGPYVFNKLLFVLDFDLCHYKRRFCNLISPERKE